VEDHDWVRQFPGSVTVCDVRGIVVEMNDRAAEAYREFGGKALIGTNLLDCHPEPSRAQLEQMLATGARNVYTIEKGGVRKLIYHAPWYRGGAYAGLVELALEIPASMPHFVREP
jgi:PAS domain-containing protein